MLTFIELRFQCSGCGSIMTNAETSFVLAAFASLRPQRKHSYGETIAILSFHGERWAWMRSMAVIQNDSVNVLLYRY